MYAIRSYYARELADDLQTVTGVEIVHPVEANAVFVRMPEPLLRGLLARGWYFYTFIGTGEARLMCSWQTTEEDIAELASDLRELARITSYNVCYTKLLRSPGGGRSRRRT